ncbi:hypothetical protein [Streptoalloteichus hindustanus]|uniref:Uncharacterized protein n=1 Tax=Streptoalloteichus hindustanus TaxID=2017 RepID=A0A1M5K8R3_STRHI|nr:hypothetical protein [Streptoalloteichus hindustanus]SHG49185.1 hypothetical protein SAMN05444320_109183 [Streptoalloteichus hindustanus]
MRVASRLSLAVLVAVLFGLVGMGGSVGHGAAASAATPTTTAPSAVPVRAVGSDLVAPVGAALAQPDQTPSPGADRSSDGARQSGELAEDKKRLVIGLIGAVLIAIVFYGRRVRKKRSS